MSPLHQMWPIMGNFLDYYGRSKTLDYEKRKTAQIDSCRTEQTQFASLSHSSVII